MSRMTLVMLSLLGCPAAAPREDRIRPTELPACYSPWQLALGVAMARLMPWVSGFQGFRVSGFLGFWVSGADLFQMRGRHLDHRVLFLVSSTIW
jgi:hypothetical protein